MKRKAAFVLTLWWLILCGALGVCLLLFTEKGPVVSEDENRTLAAMPALTLETVREGSLSEAFEEFLCDKFFLRTQIVDTATAIKHLFSALTVDELLSEETDDETLLIEQTETAEAAEPSENNVQASDAQEIASSAAQDDTTEPAETDAAANAPSRILPDRRASFWSTATDENGAFDVFAGRNRSGGGGF
jgi:hypothetical protein